MAETSRDIIAEMRDSGRERGEGMIAEKMRDNGKESER